MPAPIDVLQMGPYPEWDQAPLDAAFTMHRCFVAGDKAGFVAGIAPRIRAIATRGELGAKRDLIDALAAPAATRHIVNRAVIDAAGPDGMIINISRASNIDEDALIEALAQKRRRSAALDVFEGEPALDPRFLALDNLLLQPHHAPGTHETRKAIGKLLRDNLTAHFNGEQLLTPVL
jgi:lactate dehydrogenase-like 2-hydroxyacid dehydrogenase